MIKEAQNIDFHTTGKQPSEKVLAKISAYIKMEKERKKDKNKNVKKTSSKQANLHVLK